MSGTASNLVTTSKAGASPAFLFVALRAQGSGEAGRIGSGGLETGGLATPHRENKPRDLRTLARPELGMEQSIRKLLPELGVSMNFMLTVALVAACSVNALLLIAHL